MTVKPLNSGEYRRLAALLHQWTGIRLDGKEHLVTGRLTPRLRALGIDRFGEYLEQLQAAGRGSSEAQSFINALTTNKTSFFRESHHFEFLAKRVIPELRRRANAGGSRRLRLWSAGCSRGAEPYSMAMVCAAELPSTHGWDVRILATDLDTDVLAEAKSAIYDEAELSDVPVHLRKRYTMREGKALRVHKECTSLVTFAQANLVADPFPVRGAFDAIFCRNVMIYFDRPTQDRLVRELTQRLLPHGYFVVGHSESLLGQQLERVLEVVGVYKAPKGLAQAVQRTAAAPQQPSRRGLPDLPIKRIVLGQWHSSAQPVLISTLLGSCVSACLHDPIAKIGGMNHFMLPRDVGNEDNPARFGVHAMELLVNELMDMGADRARLRAHAFGAAAVNKNLTSSVAAQNGVFIKRFLEREGIPLVSERLGGSLPREVILNTDSGDCFVRTISHQQAELMEKQEVAAYEAGTPLSSLRPPAPFNVEDALF